MDKAMALEAHQWIAGDKEVECWRELMRAAGKSAVLPFPSHKLLNSICDNLLAIVDGLAHENSGHSATDDSCCVD